MPGIHAANGLLKLQAAEYFFTHHYPPVVIKLHEGTCQCRRQRLLESFEVSFPQLGELKIIPEDLR